MSSDAIPEALQADAAGQVAQLAKHYQDAQAAGRLLLLVDPKKIRATEFCNRDQRSLLLHDASFIRLTKSIAANGQETPIRVRPLTDAAPFEFEIVSGHRRHAACLALDASTNKGFPILAIVDAAVAERRDLVLKMYRENADREDLSPYETGMMFRQWLLAGIFETQEAISVMTQQSKQNVSRYVALASLPDFILEAFRDPRRLSLRWVSDLVRLVAADEPAIRARAEELAQRRPAPAADTVFFELLGASAKAGRISREVQVVREANRVLFELGAQRNRFDIKIAEKLDPESTAALRGDLQAWLRAWLLARRAPRHD